MRQKLLQLLLNPFIVAGLITLAIIYFLPDYFSKYRANLVKSELISNKQLVYYEDLDGDGKSEKIVAQDRQDQKIAKASYLIYKSNGDFVDQYNLDKPFCNQRKVMWFKDLNQNGIKEIYIPTRSSDSAFLNVQEHLLFDKPDQKEVFIDVMAEHNGEYEFNFYPELPFSSINANSSELYIKISNGYAAYPRNIYKYDYDKHKIIRSPHLTNSISISDIIDIDNDHKNEILLQSNSPGNEIDTIYTKRSDYSTWLNVLDDDLKFLFDPIEFKCLGGVNLIQATSNDSIKLIGFLRSFQKKALSPKLIRLSTTGSIEKEALFLADAYKSELIKIDDNFFAVYERSTGTFNIYDVELEIIKEHNIQPNLIFYHFDIDLDQKKEWIGFNNYENLVYIFRTDFKDEVIINEKAFINYNGMYGLIQLSDNKNLLYFQDENKVSYYDYGENPNYYYGYFAYLGIYGIVLGFLLLVVKGQKIVEARKRAIEKEISKLQLKTIKNQVDPHFVFNAINTISEMTLMDNKLEADKFISRFSGFMRDTLKQSDKISTTLKEELQYTENFIRLQQVRFSHSFDYQIEVDKGVDKKTMIPKHVLFTFVENAIKHGIAHSKNGLIKISAIKKPEYLFLIIEDNGAGIQNYDKPKKHSTGNGLKIMDQIFELYTKLYKRKISHKLVELFDKDQNKSGIRVEIKISNPKK